MNTMIIKRRYVTLIEMMIVITIIGIIAGALAWNFGGALERGRAFKTETGMERLLTILELAVAEQPGIVVDDIESEWKNLVEQSPFIKDPKTLIYDGWGEEYEVDVHDGEIKVRSRRYEEYRKANL